MGALDPTHIRARISPQRIQFNNQNDTAKLQDHFYQLPSSLRQRRVQITMARGEVLLFHSALMHRSLPYEHGQPRVALAARLAPAEIALPTSGNQQQEARAIRFN